MNIEARKIEFIQEFLKIQSEEVIARLEKILNKEGILSHETSDKSINKKELNKRIDQSESDFKMNRFKNTSELLIKFK